MADAGENLLEAIAAAPDDPGPRLVYADQCTDEAHGELIVVQHRLADIEKTRSWSAMYSAEAHRLRVRERTLIRALLEKLDIPAALVTFMFGFVHTLKLDYGTPANLAKRLSHPIFRAVRVLSFESYAVKLEPILEMAPWFLRCVHRLEGIFHKEEVQLVRGTLNEMRVGADRWISLPEILQRTPSLRQLVLSESKYVPNEQEARELSWGMSAARRAVSTAEEQHSRNEHSSIARILQQWTRDYPTVEHLVIETLVPLRPAVIGTVGSHLMLREGGLRKVTLHCGSDEAAIALKKEASNLKKMDLTPQPTVLEGGAETHAKQHLAIAQTYLAMGRPSDARAHFDDAYALSAGRFAEARKGFEATGAPRLITEPDPDRDGDIKRVPALLNWSRLTKDENLTTALIDRVLATAPNHAGAWAMRGLALRSEFDLDGAAEAFARALAPEHEQEADSQNLARAFALAEEDPDEALSVLKSVVRGDCLEKATLEASLRGIDSKIDHPIIQLVHGLLLRERGKGAEGRNYWIVLARVTPNPALPLIDQATSYVSSFFGAVLAPAEPFPIRRAFHKWLDQNGPLQPMSMLVFDPLVSMARRLMPNVDVTTVEREINRLRGATD
jgi:uncharacterized protein (TIGR02996 family)